MTDYGRSTSVRSGWVGCTKRGAASWIISAALLAEKVGITRESVTNQLITKCHLSSELFKRANLKLRPRASPKKIEDHGPADGNPNQRPQVAARDCVHYVTEQIDRENAYRQATAPLRLNP